MVSESAYQTRPHLPPAAPELAVPEAHASNPMLKAREPELWTGEQLNCVAAQLLSLPGLVVFMYVLRPDYISLLWRHPTGGRMLITAVLLTVCNFGLYLLLCAMLNRCFPPRDKDVERQHELLSALLLGVHLLVFFVPAVFLLLVGPACIPLGDVYSRR